MWSKVLNYFVSRSNVKKIVPTHVKCLVWLGIEKRGCVWAHLNELKQATISTHGLTDSCLIKNDARLWHDSCIDCLLIIEKKYHFLEWIILHKMTASLICWVNPFSLFFLYISKGWQIHVRRLKIINECLQITGDEI